MSFNECRKTELNGVFGAALPPSDPSWSICWTGKQAAYSIVLLSSEDRRKKMGQGCFLINSFFLSLLLLLRAKQGLSLLIDSYWFIGAEITTNTQANISFFLPSASLFPLHWAGRKSQIIMKRLSRELILASCLLGPFLYHLEAAPYMGRYIVFMHN